MDSRTVFVVMVVGALVFGLAVGYRLGSESADATAVVPSRVPTATNRATADPNVDGASGVPPLIAYGAVDDALLQAYYAGGAGQSVCDVSALPSCHSRPTVSDVPDPDTHGYEFENLFSAGPAEVTSSSAIIVAQDVAADLVRAFVISEGASISFPQEIRAVNPNAQGIWFMDLRGSLNNGRNVLVVRAMYDHLPYGEGSGWQATAIPIVTNAEPL